MGPTVLDAGPSPVPDLHLYAHCLRDHPGGVAVLVINTDRTISQALAVPVQSDRYTLTATDLLSRDVQLNGRDLSVGPGGDVPQLTGTPTQAGTLVFEPTSITFLAIPNAQNSRC
jgi:heparanase